MRPWDLIQGPWALVLLPKRTSANSCKQHISRMAPLVAATLAMQLCLFTPSAATPGEEPQPLQLYLALARALGVDEVSTPFLELLVQLMKRDQQVLFNSSKAPHGGPANKRCFSERLAERLAQRKQVVKQVELPLTVQVVRTFLQGKDHSLAGLEAALKKELLQGHMQDLYEEIMVSCCLLLLLLRFWGCSGGC